MKKEKEKKFEHLSETKRYLIEKFLKRKIPVREIAEEIGVHVSTVYREIKRGQVLQRNSDLTEEYRYCADYAENRYQERLREKGPGLKIGKDRELAEYIEAKILYDDYSPAAVLGEISRDPSLNFSVTISEWTLYKYIDMGLFLTLTNKNLPVKGRQKEEHKTVKRLARAPRGKSIEQRPAEVDTREAFGHWEMDSVEGPQGAKYRLVVLTERKTRQEIVVRVKDGTAENVVAVLDHLERKYQDLFPAMFRTITVDNGSEFADVDGLERSCRGPGKRTTVYYCHPYRSSERGSNENQNRMLRRRFPKGTDFRKVGDGEVEVATGWLNRYPREMFGYASSEELFQEELCKLA